MLIYNTDSGIVIANIPKGQPYGYLEGNNSHIIIDNIPDNWFEFKVVDYRLVKLSGIEMLEISNYGSILTEDERLEINMLNKLIPSHEEIRKAENTIEILEVLSEVL